MDDFYDIVEEISSSLDDIDLRITDIWTGIADMPDKYAEDFEKAVRHLATAKEIMDGIFAKLYGEQNDED